jgi:thiol-disulfide isomerase/thioredoxin
VIAIVAAMSSGPKTNLAKNAPIAYQAMPADVLSAVIGLTAQQFNAAGLGGSQVSITNTFAATPSQPPVVESGKPVVVYVGAEYCPFCAAARWPLLVALSRFGVFSNLGITASSPVDVYANTRTVSFAKSSYSSRYVGFDPTELSSNVCAPQSLTTTGCTGENYEKLMTLSTANAALFTTYDSLKYFPNNQGGTGGWIPFFDFGGKFVASGSLYSINLINPGPASGPWSTPLSWQSIVATFKRPDVAGSPGQAILGAANIDTAAICDMTGNKPASVCGSAAIKQAEAVLPKS